MKRLCLSLFFLFLLFSFHTKVYAHVLSTDKTVGAVLHIEPDDDPVVNVPAYLFFDFKDKTGKFNLQNCDCTVKIHSSSGTAQTLPLESAPNNNNTGSITFTFPQKDVYTLQVLGKGNGKFQDFFLTYDLRVTREEKNNTPGENFFSDHIIHFSIAIIIFILAGFSIMQKLKKKST